ncbi:phosphopantothenoylcysteine decarboxylase subunit VHS3-like [Spinacia oleracea]|uniref:Phosphopantothenoylcysteine decarboxylase subunit VHS3-like n=1 Tax=Spinacia oleracea TaxID=3562 RepID=A0ABM3QRQ6_SPIOL|nr:phosphopantothenoylcysteine decarboxylase subunit VHS3-like [Spinacia oleracea]
MVESMLRYLHPEVFTNEVMLDIHDKVYTTLKSEYQPRQIEEEPLEDDFFQGRNTETDNYDIDDSDDAKGVEDGDDVSGSGEDDDDATEPGRDDEAAEDDDDATKPGRDDIAAEDDDDATGTGIDDDDDA